jgi:DNA-binding MarR family transcriptional regulator
MSQTTLKNASALFYRTFPLIKKIFLHASARPRGEKLPPHLFSVLLCVHYGGKQKMGEISVRMGLSKPLVTQHVNRLVETGYFSRFPDADDRRIVRIGITARGIRYAKEISAFYFEKGMKALSLLSEKDIHLFTQSLETVKEILIKIDQASQQKTATVR